MQKSILISAAIFGFTGIILGAFGAHGLKNILTETTLESYKTGVMYQLFHAMFLLFLGIFAERHNNTIIKRIFYFTLIGVILFSGSIYLLSLNTGFKLGISNKILGPITPIGGLFLISAWFILFVYSVKKLK
jgi:uncharacterized membrane protein YgdD (TMEM256/DUF423 family)